MYFSIALFAAADRAGDRRFGADGFKIYEAEYFSRARYAFEALHVARRARGLYLRLNERVLTAQKKDFPQMLVIRGELYG